MPGKITDISGGMCSICGKRMATKLCDAPIGRSRFVGNPPIRNGVPQLQVPMEWVITCDRAVCDRCAIEIIPGIDFCRVCMRRIAEAGRKSGNET